MAPNLTVHHLQVGQGERIPWLLEELNIPYNLALYQRSPMFSPLELKEKHDMGASPLLEDATYNAEHPLLLAESGAITEYIIHKHGNGRLALSPSHPNFADYLYWFHFSNSGLQPAIFRRFTMRNAVQNDEDPRVKAVNERMHRALKHFNNRVAHNAWLAGEDFTAADTMSVWCFTTLRKFEPIDLTGYPGILAWLKRCTDRPAYREAMHKGDPDLVIEELISSKGPSRFEGFAKVQQSQTKGLSKERL